MPYRLRIGGRDVAAEITARRPQLLLRIGEVRCALESARIAGDEFELTVDGVRYRGYWCAGADEVQVRLNGHTYRVERPRAALAATAAAADEELRASMPGVVVAVHCAADQRLAAGDKLLTLESMKLQMTLLASHAARVRQVHVAPQAVFERGALLVSFARAGEEP